MVELTGLFSKLETCKILVAGDLLLDSYTLGKAKRISPEAPVAVIHVESEEYRPGGAGNVMLNLVSLGAQVVAIGRIGNDLYGEILKRKLSEESIDIQGILIESCYFTPVKNRIIAENQQIVRVDREKIQDISEELEASIIELLPNLLEGVQVVALSDYGKGFLTKNLLKALIQESKNRSIPIITDPKGIDFSKYAGTTLIKPNLSEAFAAANLTKESPLEDVATKVLKQAEADILVVTRSESGISTFDIKGERNDYPVRVKEVKDVTGAGDTVLAMLSVALANKIDLPQAIQLSNLAAGIAIEHLGCARVSLSELAKRLLEYDVVNKIFDSNHISTLKLALKEEKYKLIHLSSTAGFNSNIYKEIKNNAKDSQEKLLVCIQESEPQEEFLNILASLTEVDYILTSNSEF